MAQRQLRGFIEGLAEQYNCDEQVIDVIETMAQHLTGEQIEAVIKDLAARHVVEPVRVAMPAWQRQVLLNDHGAIFINNSGMTLPAQEGLRLVQDYIQLESLCAQMGFTYADSQGAEVIHISGGAGRPKRKACVFDLTFRSDGYYLLGDHELVDGSYGDLTEALVSFDPYSDGTDVGKTPDDRSSKLEPL